MAGANQDAAGASHIHPAEQSKPSEDSDIREIQGQMDGSPPIQREMPKPLTAGPHALYATNDNGVHVDPEAGAVRLGWQIGERAGRHRPTQKPGLH